MIKIVRFFIFFSMVFIRALFITHNGSQINSSIDRLLIKIVIDKLRKLKYFITDSTNHSRIHLSHIFTGTSLMLDEVFLDMSEYQNLFTKEELYIDKNIYCIKHA